MKTSYTLILSFVISGIFAQGIDIDYNSNSPSLTLRAQYDSVEIKGTNNFEGGDAIINLLRTDSNYTANILFDLSTQSIHGEDAIVLNEEGLFVEENWSIGMKWDDLFRFSHYRNENRTGLNGELTTDVLVFDADDEGTHEDPIVQMPQGRLHIGDDIKLSTTSENQLQISGGSIVPNVGLTGLGISGYDLGKDGLFSHWDDVVANEFITYSFLPDIVLAKSNTSSLDVLRGIKTYQARDKKEGIASHMLLSPKELKKVYPEALHLQDIQHKADGTMEIVEIENPGIIYDRFIPLLIDGLQEVVDRQAAYIESIEARLSKLEGE